MGMNLIGSSASLMQSVADFVDEVDGLVLDVHTVKVIINNGSWQVIIDSTNDDMEDVRHEVWLDQHGGIVEPMRAVEV